MAVTLAARYVCPVCRSEYLATVEGNGTLTCCGREMKLKSEVSDFVPQHVAISEGHRYNCETCGAQVLSVSGSRCIPACCGKEMTKKVIRMNALSE